MDKELAQYQLRQGPEHNKQQLICNACHLEVSIAIKPGVDKGDLDLVGVRIVDWLFELVKEVSDALELLEFGVNGEARTEVSYGTTT